MNEQQISMIENQAATIAKDALDSGDLMIRQLADDALALIAEVRGLCAKLDAVQDYAYYYRSFWGSGNVALPHAPMAFDEWYTAQQVPA